MAINKVSNFSDLIHRVTASCFLHPLAAGRHDSSQVSPADSNSDDSEYDDDEDDGSIIHRRRQSSQRLEEADEGNKNRRQSGFRGLGEERDEKGFVEMEMLIGEVFEAVAAMKRAYVTLQEAHCPWDPDKMRISDAAVVAELRRLGVLRERFRRKDGGGERGRGRRVVGATLREVVAPYEAAVEELKREVKVKEVEVENLREKLQTAASIGSGGGNGSGKKGRSHHQSKRRVSCSTQATGNLYSPFSTT